MSQIIPGKWQYILKKTPVVLLIERFYVIKTVKLLVLKNKIEKIYFHTVFENVNNCVPVHLGFQANQVHADLLAELSALTPAEIPPGLISP